MATGSQHHAAAAIRTPSELRIIAAYLLSLQVEQRPGTVNLGHNVDDTASTWNGLIDQISGYYETPRHY